MKILGDRAWPAELREELEREIASIPAKTFMEEALPIPCICPPGFRKDPKNAPLYRKNLTSALLRTDTPEEALAFFRRHSFYQEFVCVLSSVALTVGFHDMAAFTGGAKLVLGMLLDVREAVQKRALAFVDSGKPYPPVPADPDAARTELAKTFEPFVKAFSTVAVAQKVTVVDRKDGDQKLIATLQDDLRRSREARTAAENATHEAARRAEAAERRVQTLESEQKARDAAVAAAEAARNAAETTRAVAESGLRRAEGELTKLKSRMGDFVRFREECFQKRMRVADLEQERDHLLEVQKVLADKVVALQARISNDDEEALREHVEVAPEPVAAPPKTLRERLAEAVSSDVPSDRRRLRILIDGHNVLNLAPEFASRIGVDEHQDIRKALVDRLARIQPAWGNCETELYFDGAIRNDYNPAPHLAVHFSGGEGDHRADRAILDVLEFYLEGGDYCLVVTEDSDFRSEAMNLGSRVIGSRDFMDLW